MDSFHQALIDKEQIGPFEAVLVTFRLLRVGIALSVGVDIPRPTNIGASMRGEVDSASLSARTLDVW